MQLRRKATSLMLYRHCLVRLDGQYSRYSRYVCLGFTGFLAFKGNVLGPGDITLYQSYFATIVSQVSCTYVTYTRQLPRALSQLILLVKYFLKKILNAMKGKKQLDSVEGEFDFKNVMVQHIIIQINTVLHELNLHVDTGRDDCTCGRIRSW